MIYGGFSLYSQWLINMGAYLVGIADCFCFASGMVIGGRWSEAGISLANCGQCSGLGLFSLMYIWIGLKVSLVVYGGFLVVAIVVLLLHASEIEQHLEHRLESAE